MQGTIINTEIKQMDIGFTLLSKILFYRIETFIEIIEITHIFTFQNKKDRII